MYNAPLLGFGREHKQTPLAGPVVDLATVRGRGRDFMVMITEAMEELALVDAFSECLEAVERGMDVEAAAGIRPEARDDVLPLLEIAVLLRQRKHSALCLVPA